MSESPERRNARLYVSSRKSTCVRIQRLIDRQTERLREAEALLAEARTHLAAIDAAEASR